VAAADRVEEMLEWPRLALDRQPLEFVQWSPMERSSFHLVLLCGGE
jgi:hypothetical protein